MARRVSSMLSIGQSDDRQQPDSGSTHLSPAPSYAHTGGKLQKQNKSASHGRNLTAPSTFCADDYLALLEKELPSMPGMPEPTLYDLQRQSLIEPSDKLLPPPPLMIAGGRSRTSSRESASGSRSVSSGMYDSRPVTPVSSQAPTTPVSIGHDSTDKKKKHWWSRSSKREDDDLNMNAWVAGHPQKESYDMFPLLNGRPVDELWDSKTGNCYVHLYPSSSGRGPSFKINAAIFASSATLTKLAYGDIYSNGGAVNWDRKASPPRGRKGRPGKHPTTPPLSPKRSVSTPQSHHCGESDDNQDIHLYMPVRLSSDTTPAPGSTPPRSEESAFNEDFQTLVDYRNLVAFLCGQSLIATDRRSSFFSIFMNIGSLLKLLQFTNRDGSTYGEIANASFDNYIEELGLADVRSSREKTIEGIVLGEHMKSVLLYNEAFTHGVGRHQDILALRCPKFIYVSPLTQNRLTRAHMDLEKRTASIRLILNDFDFPFLFSGIMSSKTSEERKSGVRFDAWKESFLGMRKFIIAYYKHRYGDWPPKASNKKNALETSGLNRLVLRDVYHDLSSLYDLLVDRTRLTTRTIDGHDLSDSNSADIEPRIRGLRSVLSEYDRSSPPVKPPVPFDLPLLPTLKTTRSDFSHTSADPKSAAKETTRKIKDNEIGAMLRASWNPDAIVTPFIDAFRDMEHRAARGASLAELEDLRFGHWIFCYVVLQALPMLACDAPGLKWTKGVEYFLCSPPRSGVPWADSQLHGGTKRTWFSVGGEGGSVVSLPSDIVEHGVEGIYHRSHCWQMAERWCANNPALNSALHEQHHNGAGGAYSLHGGSGAGGGLSVSFANSPRGSNASSTGSLGGGSTVVGKRVSTLSLGLEALPLPAGVKPDGGRGNIRPRTPQHSVDASKTFDAILADVEGQGKKGKKR